MITVRQPYWLVRLRYRLKMVRDWPDDLNRRTDVESVLLKAGHGSKGKPGIGLTAEQCKELAVKLGVPTWARRDR